RRHHAQSGMIEYPAACWRLLCWRCSARLLVQPPVGESEVIRDLSGLFQDDSAGLEHRIDITSHARSIVSQSHGGAADDEYVSDDARRTRRSPSAVKARSISARPSRTSSGSVTQP